MKLYITVLISILSIIPSYALAQDIRGDAGPLGIIKPLGVDEDQKPGFLRADDAKQKEAKKLSWFEKQLSIVSLAEKKSVFHEKSIANIYKRMKDQVEWNKNYSLQRFVEVAKKAEELGNTIGAYGEHLVLHSDGSYIRYFDGRPTDVFNLPEKDNYGNTHIVNLMNIKYEDTDQFVVDYASTTTHLMEYIKLEYDPIGAVNYVKFDDAAYLSNISDRPSKYTTTEGSVEKIPAYELYTPTDTKTAKELYDKIVGDIIPSVESALTYKATTAYSNISYYLLPEDKATADTAGGVYGEKKSYDYNLSTTAAPDAPETGTVSNITYYLFDKKYAEPLSTYWWHAQDAELNNLHHGKEPKEAGSHTVSTTLGITREIDFYDAHYDGYNALSSYRQTEKISGTEVGSYYYHNISYDSYGRQTSYTVDGNTYGLSYTRNYSNIKYDTLSRITSYDMTETIDGTTISYKYWDMTYNTLWQLSDYYYSIGGVEHHKSLITYDTRGLVKSYVDTSIENGITTTIYRNNTYNSNGLLSEYTEQKLRQSSDIHEFYYTWVGNITYNSIYAISSFDTVIIKDTNATTITDYSSKIEAIRNALTFDGVNYTLSVIDMIAMGFNTNTTIYTEKWRDMNYYSVGESVGSNYYNFTLDSFSGRLKSYSKVLRTTTTTSDSAVVTNL